MSKQKNVKRAQTEGPFRNQPGGKDDGRQLCPFPNCGRTFIPEPKRPPFCDYHIKFITDFAFCVQHVRVGQMAQGQRPSGLVVPKPGASMEAAANDAIKRKEGGGP